ncbi:MAG: alpha/beta fold hydrolase [Alphaproteobacteria bacterium]
MVIPENPLPPGGQAGFIEGQDRARIRYALWEPRTWTGKGTVCLFTGRGEFIEKYFETITNLLARGFWVAIMDWRGQGHSVRTLENPRKGHITTFDQYLGDLGHFMRKVVLPDCPGPYYALAHSMGGTVLLQTAVRRQPWFERMVLVAPMIALKNKWFSTGAIRRIAEIACYAGLDAVYVPGGGPQSVESMPFSGNALTSDQARFVRNARIVRYAPSLGIGSPTLGWVHAAARAMEEVNEPEFTHRIETPILLIAAGSDPVVSTPTIEAFGASLRSGGHVVVNGARHELLMETDDLREQAWAAFDAFVPSSPDKLQNRPQNKP